MMHTYVYCCSEKLSHCELLAVDEAAAIPLPLVKSLLGPYLVFLSSTVNGYEGTGRALSLKLIDQLRKQQGAGVGSLILVAAVVGVIRPVARCGRGPSLVLVCCGCCWSHPTSLRSGKVRQEPCVVVGDGGGGGRQEAEEAERAIVDFVPVDIGAAAAVCHTVITAKIRCWFCSEFKR